MGAACACPGSGKFTISRGSTCDGNLPWADSGHVCPGGGENLPFPGSGVHVEAALHVFPGSHKASIFPGEVIHRKDSFF